LVADVLIRTLHVRRCYWT